MSAFDWITEHATVLSAVITALATAGIGVYTYVLARVSRDQAELTRKSIDLTRQSIELATREYISVHRPRLRIRRPHAHLNGGRPIKVTFLVANIGGTDARITRIETSIGIRTGDGRFFEPRTDDLELRTIRPGEECLYITSSLDLDFEQEWELAENGALEFRGAIEYVDENGVERQTGFWRVCNPKTGEFFRQTEPDPDYEYED